MGKISNRKFLRGRRNNVLYGYQSNQRSDTINLESLLRPGGISSSSTRVNHLLGLHPETLVAQDFPLPYRDVSVYFTQLVQLWILRRLGFKVVKETSRYIIIVTLLSDSARQSSPSTEKRTAADKKRK
ncbi:uncharacterized protein LOC110183185 isoform X3 [Drosophila serrata]|uniref:uncharacterized protein LOC110183185 isoform X1 n=1 Tax=Drosophila serrata TaxID=7274 RepID=UPI000A1D2A59|nr:uncharacterized protein LOC110183185 isoform X1 [Drosophila serrata]XP_020807047.1 uncharacterized protein LOC110183185 isoform X2 [Drosophila serrata]XP_020807057.1 uncharacterized protein LOC110183185 isoform X1 [Drosophila serrata]XP_020807066.1 uncharacterized protein LOC110183185 isoform X1 [Drosophila serrata]XP_020807074.1 uncharacterized protein LOC110183185 isoform X3 [Drosophila serrata]